MEDSMGGVGRMHAFAACCIVFTSRTFQHLRVVRATRAQASPLQNFPHISYTQHHGAHYKGSWQAAIVQIVS